MIRKTVTENEAGKRLDVFVSGQLPDLSRASVQKLIDGNKVIVNKVSEKPSYRVRAHDKVNIDFTAQQLSDVPEIKLPILYEDDDCLVLNKPAGVLTHSKGTFNPEATVATFIQPMLKKLRGERAGIVHRLDRATSGVMIVAKNPEALKWLQKQFFARKAKKTYMAVVSGKLQPEHAIIDMPIERNPKRPQTFRVGSNGKPAITEYRVIDASDTRSIVELKPTTGRTHQLRVHLKYLNHPIVGDTLYDGESADRLYLHAQSLELTLPNRERQTFTVPVPEDLKSIL